MGNPRIASPSTNAPENFTMKHFQVHWHLLPPSLALALLGIANSQSLFITIKRHLRKEQGKRKKTDMIICY